MRRLQPVLDALGVLGGTPLRLWEADGEVLRPVHGEDPGWRPARPPGPGAVDTPAGPRWFAPLTETTALWLEAGPAADGRCPPGAAATLALLEGFLQARRETTRLSEQLAARYEEIDLLYTMSEVLGRTIQLEAAAGTIVRVVSDLVGARRASIVVLQEESGMLRTVAARGFDPHGTADIAVDDPVSIAARVFREARPHVGQPGETGPEAGGRGYRGGAVLSVPILYAAPGAASRCVGVINLTDRAGGDRFSASDEKLIAAVANQVGAAIEIARLVEREKEQQRLHDELELAHQLQQSLLPDGAMLHGDAIVGVRCVQAEQVGGDFYTFNRLGLGLVGVMLGDVSAHGLSAALVMAMVISAAGIHAAGTDTPDQTLAALRDSLAARLSSSDTYLTVFYGILDRQNARLTWASAGHPHAFRLPARGDPVRLDATAPPLGLGADKIGCRAVPWNREEDLLCLWTDGLVDAADAGGERFGEARLLTALAARRREQPDAIVREVMAEVEAFAPVPGDDRTLLVLRL